MKSPIFRSIFCIALAIGLASCAHDEAQAAPRFAARVQVLAIAGQAPNANQSFDFTLQDQTVQIKGAAWSDWITSEKYNGETTYAVSCGVWPHIEPQGETYEQWKNRVAIALAGGKPVPDFPRLKLQVETAIEDGEKSTSSAELYGPQLSVMLWKSLGAQHIDTGAGIIRRGYGPHFEKAAIPENERPKLISFGDRFLVTNDNDLETWRAGGGGLAGLGINTISANSEPAVTEALRAIGINKVWNAVYNPPGYAFNFDPNRADAFREFVGKQIQPTLDAGWKPEDIAFWVTSDEPGWYYPAQYVTFNNDPNALTAFHEYLKANGQTLQSLGKNNWDDVKLIGRKEYSDLPSRRLFYWSNKFAPWASARFFSEVRRAYENGIRPNLPVLINFNNFEGVSYNPGPVANNEARTDPNAAMGGPDWMEFGRERAALATEDWFRDAQAANWSFYASRLRSAGDLSGVGFGALIVPRLGGEVPGGMVKKILALVGNGCKTIEFFTFGPEYLFPGNCYSENTAVYKEISNGTRLVGKAEDLLYPGKMKKPEVAILAPQSPQFWDLEDQQIASGLMDATNSDMHAAHMEYLSETFTIYGVLQRMAIPVQFLDEKALTEPDLKSYKVLYVTSPDIPQECADAILDWVRAGGVLVTVRDTGLYDRYHQPTKTLLDASGYNAKPSRRISDWAGDAVSGTFSYGGETLQSWGPREELNVRDAQIKIAFDDGSPLLTEKQLGKGRILHYTVLPAFSWGKSVYAPDAEDGQYSAPAWRDLITEPIRTQKVNVPVTLDKPLIEAPALYSEKGIAVTLLNWGTRAQDTQVSVAVDKPVTRVESAQKGALKFQQANGKITVQLSIGDVDVLQIYY